ncbi:MAG: amidohydrolase [Deltaproteobacteria bacterium]|nr:amidohydrolase [Deltaproteobacteria bacterium]
MVIDMHIHPFCKEVSVTPSLQQAAERIYGPLLDRERFSHFSALFEFVFTQISVDDIIRSMDDSGLDKAVIVAADYTTAKGVVAVTNNDVLKLTRMYPERFIPFCSVDPTMGLSAIDELERAVEAGCRGLKLVPPIQLFDFSDPKHFSLWEKALELDIIVWTHCAHQVSIPGTDARLGHPMLIEPVALRYPGLKIVLGHCGWPWLLETASMVARHANVYVDISVYIDRYHYFPWDIYSLDNVEHKVLFATDYPLHSFKETLDAIDALDIPQSFKQKIRGDNARQLLRIE